MNPQLLAAAREIAETYRPADHDEVTIAGIAAIIGRHFPAGTAARAVGLAAGPEGDFAVLFEDGSVIRANPVAPPDSAEAFR